ncbi:hypothetical protein Ccrd_001157, partial [Cynara cardunculus var. scolymus]
MKEGSKGVFIVAARQASLLIKIKKFLASIFIAFLVGGNPHKGFNKLWIPFFAVNNHMSLDHHGAYIEQQESKFVCGINDISKGMSEDTKLEFMYSDMSIHRDFFYLEGVLDSEAVADNAVEASSNNHENVYIVLEDRSLISYRDVSFFVCFRLHQALYERLGKGQAIASNHCQDEVDNKLLNLYASEEMRESRRFLDEVYDAYPRMTVTANRMFLFEC